ncbi:hypothetical protein JYQ62_17025 [Nostoc sp. UHCC 0702]|nr:hypothetical protein JYQ62_17025 [Nostoc sp. UHCC 0702]
MAVCLFAVLQFPQKLRPFFKKLLIDSALQVFVVYGSRYILQQFIPLPLPAIRGLLSYGQILISLGIASC